MIRTAAPTARRLAGAVALFAVLAGCGGMDATADDVDVSATSEIASDPIASDERVTGTTAAAPTTTTTTTDTPDGPTTTWAGSASSLVRPPGAVTPTTASASSSTATVALRHDGLGATTFGTDEVAALAQLQAVLGPADINENQAELCPSGGGTSATWAAHGIITYYRNGVFDGWALRAGSPLRSAEGIGLGSPIAGVKAVYGSRFAWFPGSSLGHEFSVNHDDVTLPAGTIAHLAGTASGSDDAAFVESFWGGYACVWR